MKLKLSFLFLFTFVLVGSAIATVNTTGGTVMSPPETLVNYIAPDPWFLSDSFSLNASCLIIINFEHPNVTFPIANGTNFTICLESETEVNITLGSSVLLVNIFDEQNNTLINFTTVTVVADTDGFATTSETTTTGVLTFGTLASETYQIDISAANYGSRRYFVTLASGSIVTLNAYLLLSSESQDIVFTLRDFDTGQFIQEADITLLRKIGVSYISIAQKQTDFVGSALFDMKTGHPYRMTFVSDGYSTRTINIEIKPTDTSFTILLSLNVTIGVETIFEDVTYTFTPRNGLLEPVLGSNQSFTFSVNSPSGTIQWFSMSTDFNGTGTTNISGIPGGGIALVALNLTTSLGDTFGMEYCIQSTGQSLYCFNGSYIINPIELGNLTLPAQILNWRTAANLITSTAAKGTLILNILTLLGIGVIVAVLSLIGLGGRLATSIGMFLLIGAGFLGTFNLFLSIFLAFIYFTGLIVLRTQE